jgi:Holliday junction resolvase-like predicted endonuclease
MEDPGEQIVGEYLKWVKNCEFISYNVQTGEKQGEIDVIGINIKEKIIYFCEVATHLGGLQYVNKKDNKSNNKQKLIDKFEKDIKYSENFGKMNKKIMLWAPIIIIPKKVSAKNNQLEDINFVKSHIKETTGIDIELIYNEKYIDALNELEQIIITKSNVLSNPISRYIQIRGKINKLKKV